MSGHIPHDYPVGPFRIVPFVISIIFTFVLVMVVMIYCDHDQPKTEPSVPYWTFVSSHKNLSPGQVGQILFLTDRCSKISGIDQSIFLSLIDAESDFDPAARSSDDLGLCQLNSRVWWFADYNIENNINGMCVVMIHYLLLERGSVYRAVKRYNGIKTNVFVDRVMKVAETINEQK